MSHKNAIETQELKVSRAFSITENTISRILDSAEHMFHPPTVDILLDAALLPERYYYVTNYPDDLQTSWVIIPSYLFEENFEFVESSINDGGLPEVRERSLVFDV